MGIFGSFRYKRTRSFDHLEMFRSYPVKQKTGFGNGPVGTRCMTGFRVMRVKRRVTGRATGFDLE
jgi:hypothetical protein